MFWVGPSCDNWNFNASNPCLYVGGNYNQNGNYGLFYVNYNTASNTSSNIGSRHLSASQAADRSPPPKGEGFLPPLLRLSPREPLRWVRAGTPSGESGKTAWDLLTILNYSRHR